MQELEERLSHLREKGVRLIDERQVYIDKDVDLSRIYPGSTLYPGVRLQGSRTLVAPLVEIGTEGPAVISNTALDVGVEIASGFLSNAVLLKGAKAGANSHFRECTILEEGASTAHAVGLKHTIAMSFVTFGSLINFCDAIIAGGRSKTEHTEIGSAFIHFNFSPWGSAGDKATPSIVGTVRDGVFLDSDRIFLGGLSGLAGPQVVDFGTLVGAGSIVRESLGAHNFYSGGTEKRSKSVDLSKAKISDNKIEKNKAYVSSLFQLKCWYQFVRLEVNSNPVTKLVYDEAITVIEGAIEERIKRLKSYLGQAGETISPDLSRAPQPLNVGEMGIKTDDFVHWIKQISPSTKSALLEWIDECGKRVWRDSN